MLHFWLIRLANRIEANAGPAVVDNLPDQPALASGYLQNRIQDSNASSQMYLRRRTTVSFRLNKNQRELAVSVEIIPGHTSNEQYL